MGKFGCGFLPQPWRGGRGPHARKERVQGLPLEPWWGGMAVIPSMLAEPKTLGGPGIPGTAGGAPGRGNLVPPRVVGSNRPMGLSGHICGASCGRPGTLGPGPPHRGDPQLPSRAYFQPKSHPYHPDRTPRPRFKPLHCTKVGTLCDRGPTGSLGVNTETGHEASARAQRSLGGFLRPRPVRDRGWFLPSAHTLQTALRNFL